MQRKVQTPHHVQRYGENVEVAHGVEDPLRESDMQVWPDRARFVSLRGPAPVTL